MIFQNLWLGIISGGLVIMTRVLGLLQLIEIDYRPDKKFRQGFIEAPTAPEGSKNKEQFPLLICSPRWGQASSLHKVRVWGGPGAGLEGCPPLWWLGNPMDHSLPGSSVQRIL